MSEIKAKKGILTRTFSQETWNRLGQEKGGWKLIPSEVAKAGKGKGKDKTGNPENSQDLNPQVPTSSDDGVNSNKAVATIKEMTDIKTIEGYVKGEKRVTVIRASEKRIAELTK